MLPRRRRRRRSSSSSRKELLSVTEYMMLQSIYQSWCTVVVSDEFLSGKILPFACAHIHLLSLILDDSQLQSLHPHRDAQYIVELRISTCALKQICQYVHEPGSILFTLITH